MTVREVRAELARIEDQELPVAMAVPWPNSALLEIDHVVHDRLDPSVKVERSGLGVREWVTLGHTS